MCAGAIYKFTGTPRVILPKGEERSIEDRQLALPFVDQMTRDIVGYLVLSKDRDVLDVVICKTFLAPDHWQVRTKLVAAAPEWYARFCQHQAEREKAGRTQYVPRH
jgi:hypothetical protein